MAVQLRTLHRLCQTNEMAFSSVQFISFVNGHTIYHDSRCVLF